MTEAGAVASMEALVAALRERGVGVKGFERQPDLWDDAYEFGLVFDDDSVSCISVPGCSLEVLRGPDAPRFDVDGVQWQWDYALRVLELYWEQAQSPS